MNYRSISDKVSVSFGDMDERDILEAEMRGIADGVNIKIGDNEYELSFYNVDRYIGDMKVVMDTYESYLPPSGRVIVKNAITVDSIEGAILELYKRGSFGRISPKVKGLS